MGLLVVGLLLAAGQAALPRAGVAQAAVMSVHLGPVSHTRMQSDLARRILSGDPSANRPATRSTEQACFDAPMGIACELGALRDINAARASEGVEPMILPTGFNSLTVAQQLMVIANLERVGRGLIPASGLSASLNLAATAGAVANVDPNPSVVSGDMIASNWAGGMGSPLLVDYLWMYDDGPGSENIDCVNAGDPGCWGHRENVLYPFDAPLVMGAAEVSGPSFGPSIAELFVGGDFAMVPGAADALLAPTWATISQPLRPWVSASSVELSGDARSAQVQIHVAGQGLYVHAAITQGAGGWQVTPASCDLTSASSCALTVSRTAGATGGRGTLTVSAPGGSSSVRLMSPASSKLSIRVSKAGVAKGRTATVRGRLTASDRSSAASQLVKLVARVSGSPVTSIVSRARTTSGGFVTFRVSPRADTRYSLVFAGSPTLTAASAGPAAIRVR